MNTHFKSALAVVSLVAACLGAQAQTLAAQSAKLTGLFTGWGDDNFGIAVDTPMVNPAGFSMPDMYASNASNPGHKTHYAAILMAYSAGRRVNVVVHNTVCTHSRPTIIGLVIAPA